MVPATYSMLLPHTENKQVPIVTIDTVAVDGTSWSRITMQRAVFVTRNPATASINTVGVAHTTL